MLLQSLWRWAVKELIPSSTTPYLDVELLLAVCLGLTRTQLYTQSPSTEILFAQQSVFKELLRRRKRGEPVAYLIGEQEFWSLSLEVNPSVLIPRPETELLVQLLLENYTHKPRKIADLGTGSGAIALALATERPAWQLLATDYYRDALQLAERNRRRHDIKNVEWRQGDWCDAFQAGERFDVIVSNPPYLSKRDPHLHAELGLTFEPKTALIADKNGLKHLETIIRQSCQYLLPGGQLFLEHGYDQAEFVHQFFVKYGYHSPQQHKDLAGHQRVSSGKWH